VEYGILQLLDTCIKTWATFHHSWTLCS